MDQDKGCKMEPHKMSNLLNHLTVSKFGIRKYIEVNDFSGSQCSANKTMRFKTPMLKSDLGGYGN